MNVYLLTIESQDGIAHYVYRFKEKALECVKSTITGKKKQNEAIKALANLGHWEDNGEQYWLDEKELID